MSSGHEARTITDNTLGVASDFRRRAPWAEAVNVLQALENEGVVYCLLRPGVVEKRANAFELDILVRPRDISVVARVLAANGFGPLASRGYRPHYFSARYYASGTQLKFDVVDDLRFGFGRSLRCVPANECLDNRRRNGRIYFLSPEYEFLRVVCSALLNVKCITAQHRQRLQELALEVSRDLARFSSHINPYLVPALRCEEILHAISNTDWHWLTGKRRTLRNQLIWKSPLSTAWRAMEACALRAICSLPIAALQSPVAGRSSRPPLSGAGIIRSESHTQEICR